MLIPGEIKAGRYRIIRLLGEGAMKRVYLAADQRLSDRPCALAEIPEHIIQEAQRQFAISSFDREAQMLATLEHPTIPKVYDFFSDGLLHYLVMEYVEGETLEAILAQRQRLPWREAATIGIQVLDALVFLHGQNPPVLYRDLKPSNVMVGSEHSVRIIDFGIARHFNPATTATMVGTQGYAPPEQYRGRNEPRSDLYSFGALMHHAVTGRDPTLEPPFSFPPVHDLANDCDHTFAELVDKCLTYEPKGRPTSAATARAHLDVIISERTTSPVSDNGGANAATIILGENADAITRRTRSQSHLCPQCGNKNQLDARFCNSCGAPTPSSHYPLRTRKVLSGLMAALIIVTVIYGSIKLGEMESLPHSAPTSVSGTDGNTAVSPPLLHRLDQDRNKLTAETNVAPSTKLDYCSKVQAEAVIRSTPKLHDYLGLGEELQTAICGDFDRHRGLDMAVLIDGGSGGYGTLFVFRKEQRRWQLIWHSEDNDDCRQCELTVIDNDIVETGAIYNTADPDCCPTGGSKSRRRHWNGKSFVVIETTDKTGQQLETLHGPDKLRTSR